MNFKSKLIVAIMLMLGITAFMSCEKEEVQSKIAQTSFESDKKMSLEEFIKSVETEEEKFFFAVHKTVDNRKFVTKLMNSPLKQEFILQTMMNSKGNILLLRWI